MVETLIYHGKLANQIARLPAIVVKHVIDRLLLKGTGKRGHIVADTLLPTQMFPRLPARATFVTDTNFVSRTQKCF